MLLNWSVGQHGCIPEIQEIFASIPLPKRTSRTICLIKDICTVIDKDESRPTGVHAPETSSWRTGDTAKHIKWHQTSIFRRLNQDFYNLKLFHSNCLTHYPSIKYSYHWSSPLNWEDQAWGYPFTALIRNKQALPIEEAHSNEVDETSYFPVPKCKHNNSMVYR